ncbi:CHAT domain-containing protein [Paraburkholderia sp. CNPSo 3281]|uniref:CHAT domain-containing protein n=1 Tax=Paraburkholderia sp. CNPSo 3281 TaxID=2940933 RepID=UPI0020B850BB|nr:CHAT domain-containing protein [Paraburkholderia sp. CNPSo 3281]MCP3715444.1 CHAT domain-containing protein [Paraburkholderia sp. CNPSo 3281]
MQIHSHCQFPAFVSQFAPAFCVLVCVACSSPQTSHQASSLLNAPPAASAPSQQSRAQAVAEHEKQIQQQLVNTSDGEQRFTMLKSVSSEYFAAGMVTDSMRVREQIVEDRHIPAGRRSLEASDLARSYALESDWARSERLIGRATSLAKETTPAELETLPREPAYAYYGAEAEIARRRENHHQEALIKRREDFDLAWRNLNDPSLSEKRHRVAANELLSVTTELVRLLVQNNRRGEALSYANEMRWNADNLAQLKPSDVQRAGLAHALAIALSSNDDYESALTAIDDALDGYRRAGVEPWSGSYADALRMRLMIALALGRIGDYRADADAYENSASINPVVGQSIRDGERESLVAAAHGQWAVATSHIAADKAKDLRQQGPESPFYKYKAAMQMLYMLEDPSLKVNNADIAAYVDPILGSEDEGNDSPTRGAYDEDGALAASLSRLTQGDAQDQALAFRIAELFHMNATQGAMSDGAARLAAATPQLRALIEQERALSDQSNDAHRKMAQGQVRLDAVNQASTQAVNRARNNLESEDSALRETEDRLHALRKQIAAQFPAYRHLTAPVIPSPTALGSVLRGGEVYVNFYAGRDASYAFIVQPGGTFHAVRIAATRADLRKLVVALRRGFDMGRPPTTPDDSGGFDLAAAAGLYQTLIAPVEGELRGFTTVYIATSGLLASVPFDALLMRPTASLAQANWWIDTAIPVRIPSASALVFARSLPAPHANEPLVAYADPSFDGRDTAAAPIPVAADAGGTARAFPLDQSTRSLDYHRVTPLPETLDEARAIASALGAPEQSVISGTRASRSMVMKTDLSNDRVVLFATHGIVPGEVPGWRKAGLALAYEGSGLDDSILTSDDIITLRLNADWVVLSACNTGLATGNAGDAISELSRAFFASGARTMLVTQWAVESHSAAAVTTGAFQSYAADATLSKADALAHVERDMLHGKYGKLYRHPYFWAAYTLTGDAAR